MFDIVKINDLGERFRQSHSAANKESNVLDHRVSEMRGMISKFNHALRQYNNSTEDTMIDINRLTSGLAHDGAKVASKAWKKCMFNEAQAMAAVKAMEYWSEELGRVAGMTAINLSSLKTNRVASEMVLEEFGEEIVRRKSGEDK